MTPHRHYRKAERLLEAGRRLLDVIEAANENLPAEQRALVQQKLMGIYAAAQVHATLAAR